jgi:predicted DNA-binding transcriptional regulator YafY
LPKGRKDTVSDQSALVRQWLLIKRLGVRNDRLTVGRLASELEVSQKTVRRDLATLNTVGFPVEETVGDYGRKSLTSTIFSVS